MSFPILLGICFGIPFVAAYAVFLAIARWERKVRR